MDSKEICSFTGKPLEKCNRFYSPDGTYMDINVNQFLDKISDLPVESLDYLINKSIQARSEKLSLWKRFLRFFKIK